MKCTRRTRSHVRSHADYGIFKIGLSQLIQFGFRCMQLSVELNFYSTTPTMHKISDHIIFREESKTPLKTLVMGNNILSSLISKNFKEFQRISKNFKEFQRISKNFKEFQRISKNFKEFQRISKNFKEFQRISKNTSTLLPFLACKEMPEED